MLKYNSLLHPNVNLATVSGYCIIHYSQASPCALCEIFVVLLSPYYGVTDSLASNPKKQQQQKEKPW